MTNGTKRRRRRKKKRVLDPQKQKQRRQKAQIRALFARLGFQRQSVEGIEFTFQDRTGELDDLFLYENVVIVCEYTVGSGGTSHVFKKKPLFDKILAAQPQWITEFSKLCPSLDEWFQRKFYAPTDARVRILYVSSEGVSEEVIKNCAAFRFIDGTTNRYFQALSKTIYSSARHELLKFFDIPFSDVGSQVHTTSTQQRSFEGYLLPEAHSSFPKGFKVVSFYADPETLLALSYVLRQDSWRDSEGLYQRILIPSKIRKMRKYLVDVKRVFVNNIIITLPANTTLNDPKVPGKNIEAKSLEKVTPVVVQVPYSSNAIGLVDGQHRVFCYYESKETIEPKIAALRKRQNLLVTGLIFPASWSDDERHRFEARLFLEINDTQARAKAGLKQSIELTLDPLSTTAIAKEITNRLSRSGPLKGILQTNVFDPPGRIKTTSIVSYGLRPLVKLDGSDSLFFTWPNTSKDKLKQSSDIQADGVRLMLDQYIQYCVTALNEFLLAAKMKSGPDRWKIDEERKVKGQWLSPTTINGLFVCMRQLAANGRIRNQAYYERKLAGFDAFNVRTFKSSHWHALGLKIFDQYFT